MADASTRMGQLELAIRAKAQQEAKGEFYRLLNNIKGLPGSYYTLTADEQREFYRLTEKMVKNHAAEMENRAIAQFVRTYDNLVHQFPELIDQARQEGAEEAAQQMPS